MGKQNPRPKSRQAHLGGWRLPSLAAFSRGERVVVVGGNARWRTGGQGASCFVLTPTSLLRSIAADDFETVRGRRLFEE